MSRVTETRKRGHGIWNMGRTARIAGRYLFVKHLDVLKSDSEAPIVRAVDSPAQLGGESARGEWRGRAGAMGHEAGTCRRLWPILMTRKRPATRSGRCHGFNRSDRMSIGGRMLTMHNVERLT